MKIDDLIHRLRVLFARLSAALAAVCDRVRAETESSDDEEMLVAIETAIATGVNTVQCAGRAIVFESTKELTRERDRLARSLAERTGG